MLIPKQAAHTELLPYMEYSDLEGGQCLPYLAQAAMTFEYLSGLQDKGHKVFCAILAQPLEVRCL